MVFLQEKLKIQLKVLGMKNNESIGPGCDLYTASNLLGKGTQFRKRQNFITKFWHLSWNISVVHSHKQNK